MPLKYITNTISISKDNAAADANKVSQRKRIGIGHFLKNGIY
jgi:hypothetical protein